MAFKVGDLAKLKNDAYKEWEYGNNIPFSDDQDTRSNYGTHVLLAQVNGALVEICAVYHDASDLYYRIHLVGYNLFRSLVDSRLEEL